MSRPRRIPKELQSEWVRRKPMYIDKDDDRYKRYVTQLKQNGFCDAETWALDSVICQFILPRLIRFRDIHGGYPGGLTEQKWIEILDKMIFAFDWSLNHEEDKYKDLTQGEQERNWERYIEGMKLFAEYFRHLWW